MPPQQTTQCESVPPSSPVQNKKSLSFQTQKQCSKRSTLVPYQHAPHYLKFNPFITSGYRKNFSHFSSCLASSLTWTNETVNIWTHFLGWLCFFQLTVQELLNWGPDFEASLVKTGVLICFQACMLLSASYHTFCCCSDLSYRRWLRADLFGVCLSLLAIYLSGIYFAFKCDEFWLKFYLLTVLGIFFIALSAQSSGGDRSTEEGFHWRLVLFGAWAAYGVLPTIQWVWMRMDGNVGVRDLANLVQWGSEDGGLMVDQEVKDLLPRIITMYMLSSVAFFFYISRIPERLLPGRFNYIFSSHNLWHVLIFIALYYWHSAVVVQYFDTTHSCDSLIAVA